MLHFKNISILALVSFLLSCSEDSNPDFEKESFTSIFDNHEFSSTFYPVDIKQTPDGGYLVLAERKLSEGNFRGIYLLKADVFGNFVRDVTIDDQYVNPVGELMPIGAHYYFFGMDALSLQAQIIKVDAQAESTSLSPVQGITYPATASLDGDGFLLLSYNHVDKTSVVSRHNENGDLISSRKNFSIGAGDEMEEPVINHFIRTGKRFPFQVGKIAEGLYYFNGFQNYTFSLVFTDLMEDEPLGVVQGQQDDGGFSAVLPLGGSRFAASRFSFGDNYFLPNVDLETNTPTVGAYLGGNVFPELIPDAFVRITKASIRSREVLIYASDTKSKRIGLFFYREATGEFTSSRYLGFSNPFELASLIQTDDEGLVVCGTTYLAGRLPRICIFKISKEELSRQIK